MNILLTGGAGYIGSHIASVIPKRDKLVIIDNFYNSRKNIQNNFNKLRLKNVKIVKGDIRNQNLLINLIKKNKIEAIIHLAALKSVKESFIKKSFYFNNNVRGSVNLINAMLATGCKKLVFSSTASLYAESKSSTIKENYLISENLNPYAESKYQIEKELKKLSNNDRLFRIVILRYFNVAGAHPSGILGENPLRNSDNLFPSIISSLKKNSQTFKIFGKNYLTKDGTAIRDYIHVMDVAKAHLHALDFINNNKGCHIFNLGSGKGYTVLSIIKECEKILNKKINYSFYKRRIGDQGKSVSCNKKAIKFLKWKPKYKIKAICQTAINYFINLK
jgi:UDP-glucose 4-epimerase